MTITDYGNFEVWDYSDYISAGSVTELEGGDIMLYVERERIRLSGKVAQKVRRAFQTIPSSINRVEFSMVWKGRTFEVNPDSFRIRIAKGSRSGAGA